MKPRGLGTNHARYAHACAFAHGAWTTEYRAGTGPYSHGAVYVSVHLKGANNTQVFKKIHCKLASHNVVKTQTIKLKTKTKWKNSLKSASFIEHFMRTLTESLFLSIYQKPCIRFHIKTYHYLNLS